MDIKQVGIEIAKRRKALGVSATAAAGAAGISRVTLHRIERGEGAPSMQNYMNTIAALGLELRVELPEAAQEDSEVRKAEDSVPLRIFLDEFPGLKGLSWHVTGQDYISPREAWDIYERNARHLDLTQVTDHEEILINNLRQLFL